MFGDFVALRDATSGLEQHPGLALVVYCCRVGWLIYRLLYIGEMVYDDVRGATRLGSPTVSCGVGEVAVDCC